MIKFQVSDAMRLAADHWGDPSHPPVILSHGGGQTRHSWQDTAEKIAARGWYVVSYDHRGHGESDWSPDGRYRLELHAQDQRHVVQSFSQPPILVGASLGGISALLAQGEADERLYRAIVLVDITPQMDQQGAMEIMAFMENSVNEGFASLDEAADAIAVYTGRKKRINSQGLGKNLRLGDDGRYYWHWDPNFLSLREDVTGRPDRLLEATHNVDVPLMLVRGRESAVVTEAVAREFLELFPDTAYVDVAEARHMVVGDKNAIFTDAVIDFIESL